MDIITEFEQNLGELAFTLSTILEDSLTRNERYTELEALQEDLQDFESEAESLIGDLEYGTLVPPHMIAGFVMDVEFILEQANKLAEKIDFLHTEMLEEDAG